MTDLAAALTYYAILSVFPGLVALVSLLGLVGQADETTAMMLGLIHELLPNQNTDFLSTQLAQLTNSPTSGVAFVVGIIGALWSASGYVGAFGRAMNRIYQIDEGRPFWKLRPLQLLLTFILVVMMALLLIGMVVSGPIAATLSRWVGLGSFGLTVFNVVKWPIMLALLVVVIAILYYATPNVRQPRFRWLSVGSFIAIVVWILLSVGYGIYVANFANYNKTYGALGGAIIGLLWVWLTNAALLFGAEVDAEIERGRELQSGIAAEQSVQLPPRDTTASVKAQRKREELIEEARRIREQAEASGPDPFEESPAPGAESQDPKSSSHDS